MKLKLVLFVCLFFSVVGKTDDKANRDKIKAEKKRIKDKEKAEKKANRKPMPRWLAILTAPIRFIFKPFAALGCYIHESWIEIRQVHWPNRKQTWKMLGAILIYTIVFLVLITILDILFTCIFNKLLG